MAEYRSIQSRIWDDEWVCGLDSDGVVLWIYLITNRRASVAGIYEIPIKVIYTETPIDKEKINELLAKFEADGKIMYAKGVMWVKNLRKYQASTSPKVDARIAKDIAIVPNGTVKDAYHIHHGIQTADTISKNKNNSGYHIHKVTPDTDTDTDTEKETESDTQSDDCNPHPLRRSPLVYGWKQYFEPKGNIRSHEWRKLYPLIKEVQEHDMWQEGTTKEDIVKWIEKWMEQRKSDSVPTLEYFLIDVLKNWDFALSKRR